jgi:PAS domain S-box-containing protein
MGDERTTDADVPDDLLSASADTQQRMSNPVIDSAPTAIYHYVKPGHLFYVNRAFREMFGAHAEEHTDIFVGNNIHPDDQARYTEEWSKFEEMRATNTFTGEFRAQFRRITPSGEIRYMVETLVRTHGAPGFVGIMTDVTELVLAQQELARVHKALASAARRAGMAEVKTNILHNVGNVLNSVNLSVTRLTKRVTGSKVDGLKRVATLIQEKANDLAAFVSSDERGRNLPSYLTKVAAQLAADRAATLAELSKLAESIAHIKQIVRAEHNQANSSSMAEPVVPTELIEDALRIEESSFARYRITIRREFSKVPTITVDKHKVLQILVNLISNAKHACNEFQSTEKQITIRLAPGELGVCIAISDNGIGIAPEILPRIFTHGFTTRANGHGFGLHSAALAAQDLKGSLQGTSAGLGRGATFTLDLPLVPPRGTNAP